MFIFDNQKKPFPGQVELLFILIEKYLDVPKYMIMGKIRIQNVVYARHLFAMICHIYFNMKIGEISKQMGLNRATLHHSCSTASMLIEYDDTIKTAYSAILNDLKRHES